MGMGFVAAAQGGAGVRLGALHWNERSEFGVEMISVTCTTLP